MTPDTTRPHKRLKHRQICVSIVAQLGADLVDVDVQPYTVVGAWIQPSGADRRQNPYIGRQRHFATTLRKPYVNDLSNISLQITLQGLLCGEYTQPSVANGLGQFGFNQRMSPVTKTLRWRMSPEINGKCQINTSIVKNSKDVCVCGTFRPRKHL
ncbi:hypothetical protein LSH36_404g03041 [Paralvinella palmiformis]|uniref:Uncharacterized protein n=1 Tax=Paralvinella palmiformis TaxID=53620 RepID=A0AAD9JDS6_9ANNE|nr:hypothetical protein LSH36_404g03041 [Paralvinella palmiformis]